MLYALLFLTDSQKHLVFFAKSKNIYRNCWYRGTKEAVGMIFTK